MLAPEPFFEPRGTPVQRIPPASRRSPSSAITSISSPIRLEPTCRCRTFASSGRRGRRSSARVRIGPSVTKLVLDAYLAVTAWRQARRERYDLDPFARGGGPARRVAGAASRHSAPLRHALEPAAAADQLQVRAQHALLRRAFEMMEDRTVFGSDVVITICQDLQDHVDGDGRRRPRDPDRERDGRRRRGAAAD